MPCPPAPALLWPLAGGPFRALGLGAAAGGGFGVPIPSFVIWVSGAGCRVSISRQVVGTGRLKSKMRGKSKPEIETKIEPRGCCQLQVASPDIRWQMGGGGE